MGSSRIPRRLPAPRRGPDGLPGCRRHPAHGVIAHPAEAASASTRARRPPGMPASPCPWGHRASRGGCEGLDEGPTASRDAGVTLPMGSSRIPRRLRGPRRGPDGEPARRRAFAREPRGLRRWFSSSARDRCSLVVAPTFAPSCFLRDGRPTDERGSAVRRTTLAWTGLRLLDASPSPATDLMRRRVHWAGNHEHVSPLLPSCRSAVRTTHSGGARRHGTVRDRRGESRRHRGPQPSPWMASSIPRSTCNGRSPSGDRRTRTTYSRLRERARATTRIIPWTTAVSR